MAERAEEPEREVTPEPLLLRSGSSRLMAGATSTFTGGAAVLPPRAHGPEQTPLLRETRRSREAAEQVQQRLMLEFVSIVGLCKVWLVLLLVLMLAGCVVVTILFVQAVVATLFNQVKPCDEPLKYYMVVMLLWSQVQSWISSWVRQRLRDRGPLIALLVSIAFSIPGWCILAYGFYMVQSAQTCPKTNPHLFFPLQRFVYAQIAVALITCFITVLGFFSLRYLLLVVSQLNEQPGCTKAVQNLPIVPKGSAELIDDDGQIMDCPICMEVLGQDGGEVVRPLCKHYYHQECLLKWCKNHVDCPMCRQQIGEPDGEAEPAQPDP